MTAGVLLKPNGFLNVWVSTCTLTLESLDDMTASASWLILFARIVSNGTSRNSDIARSHRHLEHCVHITLGDRDVARLVIGANVLKPGN